MELGLDDPESVDEVAAAEELKERSVQLENDPISLEMELAAAEETTDEEVTTSEELRMLEEETTLEEEETRADEERTLDDESKLEELTTDEVADVLVEEEETATDCALPVIRISVYPPSLQNVKYEAAIPRADGAKNS